MSFALPKFSLPNFALPSYALPYKFLVIEDQAVASLSVIAASKVFNTNCWSQFNNRIIYYQFLKNSGTVGWFDAQYLPEEPTPSNFGNLTC